MSILDFLFGWLLWFPSDVTLFAVALLTGLSLTLVRKWTTGQELLGRAAADEKRLGQLIKEAKKARKKDDVARYRITKAQIGMVKLKQEGKPLLYSLLPVALLATWAFARLEFIPPKPGEAVEVTATAPLSSAGAIVHIVPETGIAAETGWVQQFVAEGESATAVWLLKSDAALQADQLTARRANGDVSLTLSLKERRLFGIVPGLPGLPAWLVGYLIIVCALVPLLKRVLRIL